MKQPTMTLAFLPAQAGAAFDPASASLRITRHDDQPLNEIGWPLPALAARGYDGACLAIGNAVLRLMQLAHPDVFAAHPGLQPPSDVASSTHMLIGSLIQYSREHKTDRYLTAIDDLVERYAAQPDHHSSLPAAWPVIRASLLKF